MHAGARTGSITYSARTVGVGAGSRVTAAPQRSPHMFPQRRIGPCTLPLRNVGAERDGRAGDCGV